MSNDLQEFKDKMQDYIDHSEGLEVSFVLKVREYRIDNRIFYHIYAAVHGEDYCVSDAISSLEDALSRVSAMRRMVKLMYTIKTVYSEEVFISEYDEDLL